MASCVRNRPCAAFLLGILCALGLSACQPEAPPPELLIASTPEQGVEVKINGEVAGTTPFTYTANPGERIYVEVDLPDYRRYGELVDVPHTGEEEVVLQLEPRIGYVTFESDPSFAQVVLDNGKILGETPLQKVPVPVGERTYHLRLDDYQTTTATIEVEEDYQYTRVHELTPESASLRLTSAPSQATIALNDVPQAERTPAEFELTPGTYRIAVYKKGHISYEDFIELEPNDARTIDAKLEEGNVPRGMVLVPEGDFIFGVDTGSPDERPKQTVYLDAYYIDRYEVTNRQWAQVFPDYTYPEGEGNYPVTGINFRQATAYAKAIGKRLPTEMEWEKAARGPEGREYPWGNEFRSGRCNSAEREDLTVPRLEPIGKFRNGVSPYGCFDMAGNAYEWTSTWYEPYPGNDEISVQYGQVYKVLRGGSYRSDKFDVRAPRRHFDTLDATRQDYGVRLAADIGADIPETVAPIETGEDGAAEDEL